MLSRPDRKPLCGSGSLSTKEPPNPVAEIIAVQFLGF
jgi:hypothetical protein